MTEQQIDDIISCAASIYFRGDYSRDFEYVDLPKGQNFNTFKSGVMCFFPPVGSFGFDMYKYTKNETDFYNRNHASEAKRFISMNLKDAELANTPQRKNIKKYIDDE